MGPSLPSSPPPLPSDSMLQTTPTRPRLTPLLSPSRPLPTSRSSRPTISLCTPPTWPPLTPSARLLRPMLELPALPKRPEVTSTHHSRSTVATRNEHDELHEIKQLAK